MVYTGDPFVNETQVDVGSQLWKFRCGPLLSPLVSLSSPKTYISHHHFARKSSFQPERVLNPEGELMKLITLRERSS